MLTGYCQNGNVDTKTVNEFPVPTVETKLVYNGDNPSASTAPVVVKAWRSNETGSKPDAVWMVAVGGSTTADSTAATQNAGHEKLLGMNPAQKFTMNLGPGSVIPGKVKVSFKDLARATGTGDDVTFSESGWEMFVKDRPNVSDSSKGDLLFSASTNASDVGSIDYETGRTVIDFSRLAEDYTYRSEEQAGNVKVVYVYTMHLASSYVLVEWSSALPKQGFPMTLYLTDPEDVSSKYVSRGRLREGKRAQHLTSH